MPPQNSSINSRIVMPAGASLTPGFFTRPETEKLRIEFEIVTVLEGAGFALVGIDSEHARRRLGAYERPFAAGRKSRAAETAQPGVAYDLYKLVAGSFVGDAIFQQRISASFSISGKIGPWAPCVGGRLCLHLCRHSVEGRIECLDVADSTDRCTVAGTHAWRVYNTNVPSEFAGQIFQQLFSTGHCARQRVTYAYSDWRRR